MARGNCFTAVTVVICGLQFLFGTEAEFTHCAEGSEWSEIAQGCVYCPRGFHRSSYYEFCQPCPQGYSTTTIGASTIAACTVQLGVPVTYAMTQVGTCRAGYSFDSSTEMCVACAVGTYKETEGLYTCTPCPSTRHSQPARTAHRGATSQLHCLVDMVIEGFSPQTSLQAGGSTLTIKVTTNATQVRIDSVHTMADMHCSLHDPWLREGAITCTTSSCTHLAEGVVAFYVQSGHGLEECMSSQQIHVMPNPVVRKVYRNEVFMGGGVKLRMDVEHAQSASRTRAVFYLPNRQGNVTQECEAISDEYIECIVPDFTPWMPASLHKRSIADTTMPIRMHYGLIFDEWMHFANLSEMLPDARALDVMSDPVIWSFVTTIGNETLLNDGNADRPSLIFQGQYLMSGTELEDYSITIATVQCYVTMLSDASLECAFILAEYHSLDMYTRHLIQVTIGNLLFEPGYIEIRPNGFQNDRSNEQSTKSTSTQNYMIIIALLLTLIAIACVVIAIMCFNKNCKKDALANKIKNNKCAPYGNEALNGLNVSPYHQRAYFGTCASDASTISSVSSTASSRLPLPVTAVFGPGRRTGNSDVIMRPSALPRKH